MKRSYPYEQRTQVLSVLRGLEERPELSGLSQRELVKLASGTDHPPSVRTVYQWMRENLDQQQYMARLSCRGRRPKLTPEQTQLLLGYACHRRQALETVSLQSLVDFSSAHLRTNLSVNTISRIMRDHGFSSQRAMQRESRMTTKKLVDDAIEFLADLRSYVYTPDRIIVMDETGLWSNVVAPKTYHYRNGCGTSTFRSLSNFLHSLPSVSYIFVPPSSPPPVLHSFSFLIE